MACKVRGKFWQLHWVLKGYSHFYLWTRSSSEQLNFTNNPSLSLCSPHERNHIDPLTWAWLLNRFMDSRPTHQVHKIYCNLSLQCLVKESFNQRWPSIDTSRGDVILIYMNKESHEDSSCLLYLIPSVKASLLCYKILGVSK